jgi:SAM-dependent methyltransferase
VNSQPDSAYEFSSLAQASNYRRAIVEKFKPALQGNVLEIGGGIGQISEVIVRLCRPEHLTIIEPNVEFCRQLKLTIPSASIYQGHEDCLPAGLTFDAIIAVNVLEHIEQDTCELTKWKHRLKPDGKLCLFVPARPELYSPIDEIFGHFRRYRKHELLAKLHAGGFRQVKIEYFNLLGYFAWLLNFRLLRRRKFGRHSVYWFDRLGFPLSQSIERSGFRYFGQSLWVCAK